MIPLPAAPFRKILHDKFFIKSKIQRELIAEFFCTWFLMFAGIAINLNNTVRKGPGLTFMEGEVGWILVVFMAIQMGFSISGSHMNPAFSLFAVTQGTLTFIHFIYYAIAQFLGAFCGAALAYFCFIGEFLLTWST
uniref:Aquaporin n=1 Tax=Rhabditophanes sp. KR3021 TaxID=114890 RepID=A0AC35U3H5_9BILA